MSRIERRFAKLREQGRSALVTFVTAGDPDAGTTGRTLGSLVGSGADIVELGIPFSDPMADGPVIQKASERALAGGMTLAGVLQIVREYRATDDATPIVLMGYLNPIERAGYAQFAERAAAAGVDGVITVDLPPEEAGDYLEAMRANGIAPVFLVAPNSDGDRIRLITEQAGGFIYCVSLKGVTGSASIDVEAVRDRVAAIRAATSLPIGVGFGISDAASAARIAAVSDAVVVGSALVGRMEALAATPGEIPAALAQFVRELRSAMDAVAREA